jgi:NTP pyrophosphatase (non-canonical NTP hydrolase)
MDADIYLRESARTAASTFHAEIVDPAEVDYMLQAVIAAGAWADRMKRGLFYGKKPGPTRWSTSSVSLVPELADLIHAMLGCITESAEIAEHMRDVVTGAKPLDAVNLKEEFGDVLWYVALGLRFLRTDFGETFDTNIAKLRARFPDKFTEAAAIDRDVVAERAVLEQSSGTDPVHQEGDAWYFWDETWADRNGPFPDEATARAELKRYCEYLNSGPAERPPEPECFSYWEHSSGAIYQVLFLANRHDNPRYPRTVIYQGPNGSIWSRPFADWYRSFTPVKTFEDPAAVDPQAVPAAEAQPELPGLNTVSVVLGDQLIGSPKI